MTKCLSLLTQLLRAILRYGTEKYSWKICSALEFESSAVQFRRSTFRADFAFIFMFTSMIISGTTINMLLVFVCCVAHN